jgi:hypothetical protein
MLELKKLIASRSKIRKRKIEKTGMAVKQVPGMTLSTRIKSRELILEMTRTCGVG